jgi:Holliday junction resolvase YEN1
MSLSKLAVEHLEKTGRPLRLAIDISIWQFQVQAAKGGSNPAIRTLFYRLVRLLGHSIQPLFVFDGPNKPTFKRGKRSTGTGDATSKAMMKRLIRLFGFTLHDAPGEAEAECALLQQKGVVDAVLSEDVDTIMFGCGKTMRSWSAESKNGQTPTHVTVYDAEQIRRGEGGLDREGMVLVALMSGGDYIPEGIPNCGVKLACEAARAGFGTSLCRIKKSDHAAIDEWKADLLHELRTNEKGFFRTKHKALSIPDSFPNMEVLRYYTHPVVSQQPTIERLGQDFPSKTRLDIEGLREFVRDTFDWTYRAGAVKLVRVLAPSLLVQSLLTASTEDPEASQDPDTEKRKELTIVKAISNRRAHFSTDAMPELRISYVPIDMVPLDLEAEPVEEVASFGRDGLALNSDDEFDEEIAEVGDEAQTKRSKTKPFDALAPNLVWVPEHIVHLGVPLAFEDWEESQRQKTLAKEPAAAAPKRGRKRPPKKPDMLSASLDKWVKVTKNVPSGTDKDTGGHAPRARSPLADLLGSPKRSLQAELSISSSPPGSSNPFLSSPTRSKPTRKPRAQAAPKQTSSSSHQTNPWTLAGSQVSARVTKSSGSGHSKLSTNGSYQPASNTLTRKGISPSSQQQEPIIITSSPLAPASPAISQARMMKAQQASQDDGPPSSDPFPALFSSQPPAPQSPTARRKLNATRSSPAKRTTRTRSAKTAPEDNAPGMKQASIKSYGVVVHPQASSSVKTQGVTNSDPISFLSDDEESAAPLPSYPKRAFTKSATFAGPYSEPLHFDPVSEGVLEFPGVEDMVGELHSSKMRLYILQTSDVGFFKQGEVEHEEAERLRRERRAFRYSDISVIDMTGPDP